MSVTLCPGLEFQLCDIFSQSNLKPKNNSDTQELSNYFKNNNEVLKNVQQLSTRATSENISEILEECINYYFPEYQEESSIEMKSKFIPAEFQSKNPRNVDPVRTRELKESAENEPNFPISEKKIVVGQNRSHVGDSFEQKIYDELKKYFKENTEEIAVVFHSYKPKVLRETEKQQNTLPEEEYDFLILNYSMSYILFMEAKTTIGKGNSIEKLSQQLMGSRENFETWIPKVIAESWSLISLGICNQVEIDGGKKLCDECESHIVKGN